MDTKYTALFGEADYRMALDRVIALAEREIRIFDTDLTRMQLDAPGRINNLIAFLLGDPQRRINIVIHDPIPAEQQMPRLQALLSRHSHAIALRQSPDNLRHLTDAHALADTLYGVRRFHARQPCSALIIEDQEYIHPWWERFGELWELSHPCLSTSITGL